LNNQLSFSVCPLTFSASPTYAPALEDEAISQIERLDPQVLERLEQATGIALATSHVDLSQIRRTQSQDLESARRLGVAEKSYPKLTFYKEHLATPAHTDAEFLSPGHPLFGAIGERLDRQLAETVGYRCAVFIDADTLEPYRIHFFEVQVAGQGIKGTEKAIRAKLCAVVHKNTRELELISGDRLHDLAPATDKVEGIPTLPTPDEQKQVENWLKVKVQLPLINAENQCRQRELQIRQDYLQQAMESAIKDAQRTQMKLAAKVAGGDETYRVARDKAQNKVRSLQERYQNKLQEPALSTLS
jgi:hypothetical protein